MACGHYGKNLLYSSGGLNINQLELINNLLKNEIIDLNPYIIQECRLSYNDNNDNVNPIKIILHK